MRGVASSKVEDRRSRERRALDTQLEIREADDVYWVRGRDISSRGISFYTTERIEVGSRLRVGIYGDGPESALSLEGVVRHACGVDGRFIVGVELTAELPEASVASIVQPKRK